MIETPTYVVIPFALTFLMSVKRFYFRDAAGSIFRPSFLLAFGSMALAGVYLVFGALRMLPPYSALAFGVVGLIAMGAAVWQAFQL